MIRIVPLLLIPALVASALSVPSHAAPCRYFGIHVVDAATGRGVPLVELQTTFQKRYYTDSDGYVAFREPGLMNRKVWFHVTSWGYKCPRGPFGTKGVQLTTTPGKVVTIKIKRVNIAERLYRMTGYGIYRDTVLLGKRPPIHHPLLDACVAGSDTVQTAVYKGRMWWFWGDTNRINFVLGNFQVTGATTAMPSQLNPNVGFNFRYFVKKPGGFAKPMAKIPDTGSHPIWIDGLMVVRDAHHRQRLVGRYVVAHKDLSIGKAGIVVYHDQRNLFLQYKQIPHPRSTTLYPQGHPIRVNVNGTEYYYISSPLPDIRVKATFKCVTNLSDYEGLTCFKPHHPHELNRANDGKLDWTWQRGVQPVGPRQTYKLVHEGKIKPDESPYRLHDVNSGKLIKVASGSLAWNPYLKKWTFLFVQQRGKSKLGEVWFATANAPQGPWTACQKVATHALKGQNMSFYNPMQHPQLMRDGGKYIYFEGTFANSFSGTSTPVPLYNYNNVMYRLNVDSPRLHLPTPPPGLTNDAPSSTPLAHRQPQR